jgi:hypothetical protein
MCHSQRFYFQEEHFHRPLLDNGRCSGQVMAQRKSEPTSYQRTEPDRSKRQGSKVL